MPKRKRSTEAATLTSGQKLRVAAQQNFKCANNPNLVASGIVLVGLEGYKCPFWKIPGNNGVFDESSYEVDHILEQSRGGLSNRSNLQALCVACHQVKTLRYTTKFQSHDSKWIKLVTQLKEGLIRKSQGKGFGGDYKKVRSQLLEESRKDELPNFVQECSTLKEFSTFITAQCKTRKERISYLEFCFEKCLIEPKTSTSTSNFKMPPITAQIWMHILGMIELILLH